MATINLPSGEFHFTDSGRGPAVLLIHGFPLDGRMWRAQIQELSGEFRVVVPDLRAMGRTRAPGPFSMELLADDLHALARALRLDRLVVGGLSMGGYVALAFARKYPDLLDQLMLFDTRADADAPPARENRDRMIQTVRQSGVGPIAQVMIQRLIPESARQSRPALVRELMDLMEAAPAEGVIHALQAMRDRPDQTDLLSRLAVPALVVVGEQDMITPVEVARAMHQRIAGSTLAVIPAAGHMAPMEQPALVNQAIRSFLHQRPASA